MSRAMAGWIGQNNGEIDKQDLQSRTGSDGVVYANSKVKDLFDKVQLNLRHLLLMSIYLEHLKIVWRLA